MSEINQLDKLTENLLKVISERPITLSQIAFSAKCSPAAFGESMKKLIDVGYIKNARPGQEDDKSVQLDVPYQITVDGRAYLESIIIQTYKERKQFIINILNATISLTALIKAFWNEISELVLRLMQP